MVPQKQEAAEESRLQWLDEELREAKAALHKVEHELEQALSQIWNLDSGLRKLEENISDARGAADALPGIQEDIRQLRTHSDRLQDRQNELSARADDLTRMVWISLPSHDEERRRKIGVSRIQAALIEARGRQDRAEWAGRKLPVVITQ